jgi:DNA polymerase-3 subunit gamma/tau
LPTIISRCQSFDFRRPSIETLVAKLGEISKAEGIAVEPEALTVIAREGRGSFRDAEGLSDQLSSFAEGEITTVMVRELLGSVGPRPSSRRRTPCTSAAPPTPFA